MLRMTHHQPAEKERMRGHGALLGAVDTTLHVSKNGASRIAEVVKSSDHEEGQRIAFTLKSVTIDQDDGYGDPVTAPVMVEDEVIGTSQKPSAVLKGANKIALRRVARGDRPARRGAARLELHPDQRQDDHDHALARLRLPHGDQRVRQPGGAAEGICPRQREAGRREIHRNLGAARMDRRTLTPDMSGSLGHPDKTDTPKGVCPVCPVSRPSKMSGLSGLSGQSGTCRDRAGPEAR